ncbi:MAG: site-2 protease family protein, partial [Oscillibacter sp.]|nr:site-2 protease family protein [Oscillibacter sp.]
MRILYILAAILIFGFLVISHELGHFLAAKLCNVQVNEFSFGMGPLLWKRKRGETQYSVRALPIGGYCAMEGEDGDSESERAFSRQGFWQKLLILVAGAGVNFLTGLLLVTVLFLGAHVFFLDSVAYVSPEIAECGLQAGDEVYRINGYRAYLHGDSTMFLHYASDTADVEVVRGGEHILVKGLRRQTVTGNDGEKYEGFGVTVGIKEVPATFTNRIRYIFYQTVDFVQLVWFSLAQLVSGHAALRDFNGPVGIVSTIAQVGSAAETARAAWSRIGYFAALLAVNLSVVNLLPLPALDGGRILFLIVDAISMRLFKKKIPDKYQALVNTIGLLVLMAFMLLVTF